MSDYWSHDLRFAKVTDTGFLTLFLNYIVFEEITFNTGSTKDKIDGFALGVLYEDTKIFQNLFSMKGKSTTGIFYSNGAAKWAGVCSPYNQESFIDDMLSSNKDIKNTQTLRFINYNNFENDTFGIMSNLVYEYTDDKEYSNTEQDWFSVGLRPYLFLHHNTRLLAEVGYDYVNDRVKNEVNQLTKVTTAVEFALKKGIWERPVLRFYYTYADYGSDETTTGSFNNAGVQLEYWW